MDQPQEPGVNPLCTPAKPGGCFSLTGTTFVSPIMSKIFKPDALSHQLQSPLPPGSVDAAVCLAHWEQSNAYCLSSLCQPSPYSKSSYFSPLPKLPPAKKTTYTEPCSLLVRLLWRYCLRLGYPFHLSFPEGVLQSPGSHCEAVLQLPTPVQQMLQDYCCMKPNKRQLYSVAPAPINTQSVVCTVSTTITDNLI